jgi:TetR/AcrR family transcriptional repressor of nem operon
MDAFWRHGYEATSMAELCQCTGLHKGSLYQAFGDKHSLFMNALNHYSERQFNDTAAVAFLSESPLENIRAIVNKICEDAMEDRGCMMINSMVELAPHDPEVRALLEAGAKKRQAVMAELISKAQEAGEINNKLDAARLARQLMVTMAGAAAGIKGFLSSEDATETLNDVLDSWT